jgi:hypothetical protein
MLYTVVNGKNIGYGDIYCTNMRRSVTEGDWQERVKGLLKAELKRRGVSYKQLAEKLKELGVDENDRNIANKLARGGFSAVFLVQCLEAIGCNSVQLRSA